RCVGGSLNKKRRPKKSGPRPFLPPPARFQIPPEQDDSGEEYEIRLRKRPMQSTQSHRGQFQEDSSLMNVLVQTPSLRGSRVLRAMLAVVLLALPLAAFGQEVVVATGGIVSVSGQPIIYNGQYVIQKTDFGFLWLDTVALIGGLVQVEAKCGVGQPPSATNLFVI